MSTQPKAILLAIKLELHGTRVMEEAATELRALHAANIDCVDNFNALMSERNELLAVLQKFSDYVRTEQSSTDGAVTYSTTTINHFAFLARDAITKTTGANT